MKAMFFEDGHLSIQPDNEVEKYALNKWWHDWCFDRCKATLSVGIDTNLVKQEPDIAPLNRHCV